ncbi:roadblock/LC7 domain-containing protein [Nocardiopsis tropica]|uniref:Roadblock/LC7 domain-containing protein n=1 Tax=Nocardiopsis tropica TaxID=109330 RepID=A0ABU7KUV5_9ACTN|nr:roadblock/LC7 domain-containing protein [Nocardiopsis umidischolae]MEE2053086.1 roadblock/LC7 domain-containing protein [Nocardiopsis umidischolae]
MNKTGPPSTSPALSALLAEVPGVENVVLCTEGGMVHTLARGADRRGADQLSALGSFLFSGAGRIGSLTRYGAVDHVVIRLRGGGSLLVRPVGEFLRVVMLTRADTPLPRAAVALDRLVQELEGALPARR